MGAGRFELAIAQTDWVAGLLGSPIPPGTRAKLNPYRTPAPARPRVVTPEERAVESKAGWDLIWKFFGSGGGKPKR